MLARMFPASPNAAAVVPVTAAVALLVITLFLFSARPAAAHTGGDADVVLTLDDVPAALEGMTVEVVNRLAPQVVLANPTQKVVEVLGLEGRPFLRIGPDGVEANVSVAEWYTTNDPFDSTGLPEAVGGEDRWGLVAEEPSWGWFDHRLHPAPLRAPEEIVAIGRPADFDRWMIELTVDGVPTTIGGAFRYQPLRGGFVPAVTDRPSEDIDLVILPGLVPGLFLDNRSGDEVVVLGTDDEPFLRFTAAGTVQANLRSPSWVASARSQDGSTPADVVDADAEPEWATVADAPRYGWIDPRLSYPDREPPEEIIDTAVATDVADWSVPVLVSGQPVDFSGIITWQPDPDLEPREVDSRGAAPWVAVGVVALLAAAGVVLTRRRRS